MKKGERGRWDGAQTVTKENEGEKDKERRKIGGK